MTILVKLLLHMVSCDVVWSQHTGYQGWPACGQNSRCLELRTLLTVQQRKEYKYFFPVNSAETHGFNKLRPRTPTEFVMVVEETPYRQQQGNRLMFRYDRSKPIPA